MRCKHCRKLITGQYIEAEGLSFHPQCFVCGKCKTVITGSYQTIGKKYYHPECYKEKLGLTCAKCGRVLGNSWVEHKGKKYHSQCLQIRCKICGQAITGEYTYDKEGKYHQQCYLNHKAPRCSVCDQPILGKYLLDEWGNQAHEKHEKQEVMVCNYCGRVVSFPTSNSGYTTSDGRLVCGICKLTAVEDERQVKLSLGRVLELLAASPPGFDDIPGNIPLQLVDKPTLKRLGESQLPDHGEGLTKSHMTYRNNKRIKVEYQVIILSGMPRLEFEAVLAHELLHVWLIEKNITLSKKDSEGFCNLGSALVYQADASKFARILLKKMENNTDRLYGKGFRKMNDKLQRLGWKKLKNLLIS